jgi:AcrR family transcriptional regulator
MGGQPHVRAALTAAAIELFLARGYEATTAEDIAEAAGVARRTFFRYFRTKEDAVLPDHDECLARVEEVLGTASPAESGFDIIGRAAHLVLAIYADDDPATAARRYELLRRVEPLREREITTTSRYQRLFAEYLCRRLGDARDGRLRAEVAAAAVVAAHNQVLRQWLRAGGAGDPHPRLEAALRLVADLVGPWLAGGRAAGLAGDPATATDEVVVIVMPRGTPAWRVVQQIEAARL